MNMERKTEKKQGEHNKIFDLQEARDYSIVLSSQRGDDASSHRCKD